MSSRLEHSREGRLFSSSEEITPKNQRKCKDTYIFKFSLRTFKCWNNPLSEMR